MVETQVKKDSELLKELKQLIYKEWSPPGFNAVYEALDRAIETCIEQEYRRWLDELREHRRKVMEKAAKKKRK